MRCLLFTFLSLLLGLTTPGQGKSLYQLIQDGQLTKAHDSLSARASAATRDGNTLFYQSLLEPDADQSARLMQAALKATLRSAHREEITYRLAQYYLLRNNYDELSRLVADYRAKWESGRFQVAMRRLSVLVDELQADHESALQQCDRFLLSFTDREPQQLGLIDKARILSGHGKRIGADKTLRQLSRARQGIGVAPALYLLCQEAITRKRPDDAIFYYNILREGFPSAVGIDELMLGLGEMSSRSESDNRAEQLTGTYYSIKVGVFSEPGNARRQADLFRGYDQKVEIATKDISGRKYRVVYVGRFDDYEEALQYRLQLEGTHHEAYQVVAR